MRVHLSRWVCSDVEVNFARLAEEVCEAAACSDLVVFPESFLHGYARRADAARAHTAFGELSAAHPRVVFVFGSHSEEGRNRMTVWRAGRLAAAYDKVHLFAPNGERELWQPGDRYVAVRMGRVTAGLVNCNDLRFPEQTRALKIHARCSMFIVVAWWPWRRDHVWRTLLQARAIENHAWTLGCCVAASDHPTERFAGAGNYVFDPHGEAVRTPDDVSYVLDIEGSAPPVVDPLSEFRDIGTVETVVVPD
jgi:predicted amidohydrolase